MPNKKQGDKLVPQRDASQFGEDGQAANPGAAQSVAKASHPRQSAAPMHCAACQAALADALDGLLDPERQKAFDEHAGGCEDCGQAVADARRGLAWLEILKQARPDPPPALLARILAQTSGAQTNRVQATGTQATGTQATESQTTESQANAGQPARVYGSGVLSAHGPINYPLTGSFAGQPTVHGTAAGLGGPGLASDSSRYAVRGAGLSAAALSGAAYGPVRSSSRMPPWAAAGMAHLRQTVLQPRLAMTAAMAFFSISLTLNLMGVRLADLKASDLKPSSLRRSFYEANAHVVRNLDNLRVVYEVEARVRDLRRASEPDDSASGAGDSSGSDAAQPQHSDPANKQPEQPKQPEGTAKPGERKQTAPKGNSGTSRREGGGEPSGRRLAVGARAAQHRQSYGRSALVEFRAGQQPRHIRQPLGCRRQAAIKAGLYAPMKLELTAPAEVEQFVTQGQFSASGMPERRMA